MSHVMTVFLLTSLGARGVVFGVHVNGVRFAFPMHAFLVEPRIMSLALFRPGRTSCQCKHEAKSGSEAKHCENLPTIHFVISICCKRLFLEPPYHCSPYCLETHM